jgi:hypothetical protein
MNQQANQQPNQQPSNPAKEQAPSEVPSPTLPVKNVPNQNDKVSASPAKK